MIRKVMWGEAKTKFMEGKKIKILARQIYVGKKIHAKGENTLIYHKRTRKMCKTKIPQPTPITFLMVYPRL